MYKENPQLRERVYKGIGIGLLGLILLFGCDGGGGDDQKTGSGILLTIDAAATLQHSETTIFATMTPQPTPGARTQQIPNQN